VNGRKLFIVSGLLRNSTKIATQFLGFEQCSQKAPGNNEKLKQRPDCSQTDSQTPRAYHRANTPDNILAQTVKCWGEELAAGGYRGSLTIRPRLRLAFPGGGFLRALSESQFLRSKNG
jgi:hypothetical protein